MTSARELSSRLADLLAREHGAMADFLVALADFDRRQIWVDLGHSSLFYFLHRELGLSAGAAQLRKTAAGLLLECPEVEAPLRDGRLCLSTVCELAKVLTPGNRAEVLPRFFHRSRREAMAVAAAISPADAVPQRVIVTAVRTPAATVVAAPAQTAPTLDLAQESFHPDEMGSPRKVGSAAAHARSSSTTWKRRHGAARRRSTTCG